MLLYGFLDTFSFKATDINNSNNDNDNNIDHINIINERESFDFFGLSHKTGINLNIIRLHNYDYVQFMEKFYSMTQKYRIILMKFRFFIVIFCIDVIALWTTIAISILFDFFSKDCQSPKVYYVHYVSETFFYYLLWVSIIYKLHRNHQNILRYRNNFTAKIAITNNENAISKILVDQYLKVMTDYKSPFAFFGINPSTKTLIVIFTSVVLPIVTTIAKLCTDFDVDIL